MKKLFSLLLVLTVFIGTSFAYTPSSVEANKISLAAEKIMEIISQRTVEFGNSVVQTIGRLQLKYKNDDRASYILSALHTELAPFMNCVRVGGVWVLGADECEEVDRAACIDMGGFYNECASACRHEESLICTLQCVQVCEVSVDRDMSMTSDTYLVDGQPVSASQDIYKVNSTLRSCKNEMGYMDTCFQVKPENQLGWDLSLHGVIGLDWQAGHIYTVRAVNINGTLNLVELLDKEVDLSVCTEINDGCNTCEVKNGVISDCSERSCSYMHTNTYQTCTQVK